MSENGVGRKAIISVLLFLFCCFVFIVFNLKNSQPPNSLKTKASNPTNDVQVKTSDSDFDNEDPTQNHVASVYMNTTQHSSVQDQNSEVKTLVIILGYQRGGSTFLGEIFNAHPAVFYSYEPVRWIQVNQLFPGGFRRSDIVVWNGRDLIRKMESCNYKQLSGYLKYQKGFSLYRSRAVARKLGCDDDVEEQRQVKCRAKLYKATLKTMEELCNNYRFHVLKVLRLHAIDVMQLLDLPGYKVKIIYLMRDPRGLLNSRTNVAWGAKLHSNTTFPREICFDLLENLDGARSKELPLDAIKFVRYEDVADNVIDKTKEMFDFVGLQYHDDVDKFLKSHALGLGAHKSGRSSSKNSYQSKITTYRHNSSQTAHAWSKRLSPELLLLIEKQCGQYMRAAGYDIKYVKNLQEIQRLRGYQGGDMHYGKM